jgi:hypothetical protein
VVEGLEYGIIVQNQCQVAIDGVGVNLLFLRKYSHRIFEISNLVKSKQSNVSATSLMLSSPERKGVDVNNKIEMKYFKASKRVCYRNGRIFSLSQHASKELFSRLLSHFSKRNPFGKGQIPASSNSESTSFYPLAFYIENNMIFKYVS